MMSIIGAGAVGLLDDWLKFKRARNLGLTKRTKLAGQLLVAASFVLAMLHWAGADTVLTFTRASEGLELGPWLWSAMAVLWILGSTNAVNLTDGLDGLAAGSSALGFAAYVIIAFWQLRYFDLYNNPHALDLAVVAASMLGGCVGFLWWNAAPAQIFMGDAGALALGGGFATLAITTNTHLLLPVIGFLFVVETLSVILQIISFRATKGRRRAFRMAPLHHHFELGGWPETTVIVRFWIIAGLFTAVGLGLYYFDFLSTGVVE
jgi:phospho-N-acetylmuramoyl-pentapeptide-transferase